MAYIFALKAYILLERRKVGVFNPHAQELPSPPQDVSPAFEGRAPAAIFLILGIILFWRRLGDLRRPCLERRLESLRYIQNISLERWLGSLLYTPYISLERWFK